jgi:prevent-host-death family protein
MKRVANTIAFTEAKAKLSELLDRVARGEEFIITRHDQRVAKLVPASKMSRDEVSAAIEKLRELRKGQRVTIKEILAWKNEGRR